MQHEIKTNGLTILIKIDIIPNAAGGFDIAAIPAHEQTPEQRPEGKPAAAKRGRKTTPFILNDDAFKNELAWREKMAEALSMPPEKLEAYIKEFILFCECTGKQHDKIYRAKAHFFNWVKRAIKMRPDELPAQTNEAVIDDSERARMYNELYGGGENEY